MNCLAFVGKREEENFEMVSIPKHINTKEIRRRAEEIRNHWTAAEKLRRIGLPPDVPPRLRAFILGQRESQWRVLRPEG